jgi:hypothetical protein
MSNSISNNLNTQYYSTTQKKNKPETSSFTITKMDEKELISDEELINFQNELKSKARMLPKGVGMTGEEFLKHIESTTAKIVFEFGQDGSIRIKEGLSQADYRRAELALRDIEFWRRGGTLSAK